ncbi:MAG: iron-containing alcohol dehydrogenase, partial [Verrucomicrobia bacterium]|nr:iron-containing alcohol dehydrogenase [Verrucomicrobiota bacterium]
MLLGQSRWSLLDRENPCPGRGNLSGWRVRHESSSRPTRPPFPDPDKAPMIEPFASRPAPKLVFGPGSLRELPATVRELGATAVFLVSDAGIARAGHLDTARRLLESAGLPVAVFADTHENPTESDAAACCAAAQRERFDCFVALGGGSSLDTAKACNFLLTNGGAMRDYQGYGKATQPMLPLVAVPTTAGTGSECQSYALVSRDDTHEKMACGDPKARAATALLDPDLTATQPRSVAILTGLDALAHALESAVCTRRSPLSSLYSESAFRHLARALPSLIAGRAAEAERADMQLGAALAGLAIENSMLGGAHASANPLTARHGVVHGRAVAAMLPHVMRFNAARPEVAAIYGRLSAVLQEEGVSAAPLLDWVGQLVASCAFPPLDGAAFDCAALAREA